VAPEIDHLVVREDAAGAGELFLDVQRKPNLACSRHAEGDRRHGEHLRIIVLAVISNCPQINKPVNDYNPTPIRVVVTQGAEER
jgi:hypothetical protein